MNLELPIEKIISKIFFTIFATIAFIALIAMLSGATHHWTSVVTCTIVAFLLRREIRGKTISLVGLEWDRKNLRDHADFDGAQESAAQMGKRCPTADEFKLLNELPNCWNPLRRGRHYGRKYWWMFWQDALFLPAVGFRHYTGGALTYQGTRGLYWTSTQVSYTFAVFWSFPSGSSYLYPASIKAQGFSVRCVK